MFNIMMMMISGGFSYIYILRSYFVCMPLSSSLSSFSSRGYHCYRHLDYLQQGHHPVKGRTLQKGRNALTSGIVIIVIMVATIIIILMLPAITFVAGGESLESGIYGGRLPRQSSCHIQIHVQIQVGNKY